MQRSLLLPALLANGLSAGGFGARATAALPLGFEANSGQLSALAEFGLSAPGYSVELSKGTAIIRAGRSVFTLRFGGASKAPRVEAIEELPGKVHYFELGRHVREVSTYRRIAYLGIYPGIDVVYYGNDGSLEFDF